MGYRYLGAIVCLIYSAVGLACNAAAERSAAFNQRREELRFMKICYKLVSSRVRASLPKNALAGVACVLPLLLARPSHAGTIVVNSAADTVAYDGVCTLREAVISANADVDYADCTGASGFDTLIVNATPVLSSNEPIEISSGIMLQGGNYPLLRPIIGKYSQFVVDQTATLELSDIKLTQFTTTAITVNKAAGLRPARLPISAATCWWNTPRSLATMAATWATQTPSILSLGGNVTITASILQNNVGGIKGAAVLNQNGSLDINGSSFISNVVDQYGGAIHNYGGGYAYIYNSTFGGNQQTGQTPGLGGGAIYNSSGSTVDIDFCTIAWNSSVVSGGGIRNEGMMMNSNARSSRAIARATAPRRIAEEQAR